MLRNRQTPPRAQNVSGMLSGRDLGGGHISLCHALDVKCAQVLGGSFVVCCARRA